MFQIVQIVPTVTADFPKMQERKEGQEFVLTAKLDGSPPPKGIWLSITDQEVEGEWRDFFTNKVFRTPSQPTFNAMQII